MTPSPSPRRLIATTRASRREDDEPPIEDYIPPYLKRVVAPYHGDFCQTPLFHPRLLVQLMAEGFLPIATRGALLPKLHQERSVIDLNISSQNGLHVSKSVRKKASKFTVKLNTQFSQVVEACHEQHAHCWLYPPLVDAFKFILARGGMNAVVGQPSRNARVQLHSVEVFYEDGTLVAGELGYSVGSMFTSLTGFSNMDSAGSVQLAALGRLLQECGFQWWDLGMDMEYKERLGAMKMKRQKFVYEVVHGTRHDLTAELKMPNESSSSCRALIDNNPQQQPTASSPATSPKRKPPPKPNTTKRQKSESTP